MDVADMNAITGRQFAALEPVQQDAVRMARRLQDLGNHAAAVATRVIEDTAYKEQLTRLRLTVREVMVDSASAIAAVECHIPSLKEKPTA